MTAIVVGSLGLLLVGSLLMSARLYLWDAALLIALGLTGIAWALRNREGTSRWPRLSLRAVPASRWVQGAALFLSATVGVAARARPGDHDFSGLLGLWVLAGVGFAATLFLNEPRPKPERPGGGWGLGMTRAEWIGLGVLLLLAGLARGLWLEQIPGNLGGDEGTQARAALTLWGPPLGNPFATGWYSVPTLSFFLYGLSMRIFGATVAGVRALSAIVGLLTVLGTFLLGRALGGRRVGWVAGITLACSAYGIHYSRLASNQVFDPLIGVLAFWLVWQALEAGERSEPWWGLAGLVAGVGWYLYFGARWVTPMLALFLGWRMLVEPRFLARQWRGLAILAAGWLVATLPLLAWYLRYPAELTSRYNQVSIFASGWLAQAVALTGRSEVSLLLEQLWKSFTAFHLTPDPTFWYYPDTPLVDFVTGALMLVGLVAAGRRWRWPARGLTLLWFISTVLMAWALTENPPSSQRGLLTLPVVALLVGWGVEALFEIGKKRLLWVRQGVLAMLLAMTFLNLNFYFQVYSPRRIYGNPSAEIAMEVIHFLQAHPAVEGVQYYFLGPPVLNWGFGSFSFLLPDLPVLEVPQGEIPRDATAPARFIVVAGRDPDFSALQAMYPGGQLREIRSAAGRLLAWIYDWPAPGAP